MFEKKWSVVGEGNISNVLSDVALVDLADDIEAGCLRAGDFFCDCEHQDTEWDVVCVKKIGDATYVSLVSCYEEFTIIYV